MPDHTEQKQCDGSGWGRWSKTLWIGPVRVAISRGNGLRRYFVSPGLLIIGHYALSIRLRKGWDHA